MYDFSLDRKQIILLVSGLVLAAVLLFVAGLTVGLAHTGNSHTQAQSARPAQPGPVAQPAQNASLATAPATTEGSNAAPSSNPIASAASLAPRQPTAAPAPRLHAAQAQPKPVAERPAPAPVHAQPAEAHGAWFLQAGAFSREANASALQKKLMQSGYAAEVERRAINGRTWYLVTAGHYASKQSATNAAHRIAQRLGIHPAVRQ